VDRSGLRDAVAMPCHQDSPLLLMTVRDRL